MRCKREYEKDHDEYELEAKWKNGKEGIKEQFNMAI